MDPQPSKRVRRLYQKVLDSQANCAFDDLCRLLEAVGFVRRAAKGSHHYFKLGAVAISVPYRRPVKEHYVRQALALVDAALKGEST